MKYVLLTLITTLLIISCSSVKIEPERRCKSILINDYKNIVEDKFISIVNNDTLLLNEIKYECVYSAMYIKKGMYDRFGKWHQIIYTNENKHPIFLWNNIKLFENDSTEFKVVANGLENTQTIYASVLVFDKENKDLLADDSQYKEKLIEYFSEMIKTNNNNKRDFYEIYWKTIDPKRWEEIKNVKQNY